MRIGNAENSFVAGTKAVRSTEEFEIRDATTDDLHAILAWLELEHEQDGHGFWVNRRIIVSSQAEGELSVCVRKSDQCLAGFLVSDDHSMDILEIKHESRGQGLGRMLAEHGLRRIEQAGEFGVAIECMPETSVPFWEHLRFQRIDWPGQNGIYYAYLFPKQFTLPKDVPTATVEVKLRSRSDPFVRKAAETGDGEFQLEERIVAFVDDWMEYLDVRVNGELISRDEIGNSGSVGVTYESPFFGIDLVRVPANGNE